MRRGTTIAIVALLALTAQRAALADDISDISLWTTARLSVTSGQRDPRGEETAFLLTDTDVTFGRVGKALPLDSAQVRLPARARVWLRHVNANQTALAITWRITGGGGVSVFCRVDWETRRVRAYKRATARILRDDGTWMHIELSGSIRGSGINVEHVDQIEVSMLPQTLPPFVHRSVVAWRPSLKIGR